MPPRVSVRAQIDTGSSFSAIDLRVIHKLDGRRIDQIDVYTPRPTEAPQTFDRYVVSLALPAAEIEMFFTSVMVLGCAFTESEGIQAMLGRDVLEDCLLVYDGQHGTFSLAF